MHLLERGQAEQMSGDDPSSSSHSSSNLLKGRLSLTIPCAVARLVEIPALNNQALVLTQISTGDKVIRAEQDPSSLARL